MIPATDPAPAHQPARPIEDFKPTPADEERLGQLVRTAREALVAGDASTAVMKLSEAQDIAGWTQSRRAPGVLYWLGHAYDQLGERTAAIAAYRRTLTQYPNSPQAERARRRLTELEYEPGETR